MLSRALGLGRILAIPALLVVVPVTACGGDDPPASNATTPPGEDGGVSPDGAPVDPDSGTPPPVAQGDPCRGQPVPDDQHYSPPETCTRLVASGVSGLREIAFAPNGDLFGQSTNGTIWMFRDDDGDGFFTKAEIRNWGTTGGNGNNVHIDAAGGFIYAGSSGGVKRFPYDPTALKGGAAQDVVVGQPAGGHTRHTTHVYDGFLYVHSGSTGNATHESGSAQPEYDTKRSVIKRFDLSKAPPYQWDAGEVVVKGVRNGNGFARNEITKKIYDVSHGLDDQQYKGADVHNDNPGEQILEVTPGKNYGYPYCFTAQRVVDNGNVIPPGTQLINVSYQGNPHNDAWCATNSAKPTTFVQAHAAPMDITFFDKQPQGALPEKWRGGAFISLHGSWNRSPATGYKVVWQPFNPDGTAPNPTSTMTTTTFPYEVVFGKGTVAGGPADGAWSWSDQGQSEGEVRPVGVAVGPVDGALYISSDDGGNLYRVGLKK